MSTSSIGGNGTDPGLDKVGWVSQPNGRGTIDILWSCLSTVFFCTWTAIHLNVPARTDTYWTQVGRKLRWMLQALLAPEFVLGFATGQRAEAKRSVELFQKSGHKHWNLRHAFFFNMGGVVLQPYKSDPFPVNSKQICYLVEQGYIDLPKIDERDICDRSKSSGFAKFLTCLQTLWLAVQVVSRAIEQLPITTLELTTLSFVICTIAMYWQWMYKPLDVETPIIISMSIPMQDVLLLAGDAANQPYKQTPLDFVDDQSPSWLINVQPHLGFRTWSRQRPLSRFNNDRFPVVGATPNSIALFFVNMAYASVHVIGWRFNFPTVYEMWLWRSASITIIATTFVFWMCESYQDGVRLGRWNRYYRALKGIGGTDETYTGSFIPKWEVTIMLPVTALYTLARVYLVVECFVGLRLLPPAAYQSVNWVQLAPHI